MERKDGDLTLGERIVMSTAKFHTQNVIRPTFSYYKLYLNNYVLAILSCPKLTETVLWFFKHFANWQTMTRPIVKGTVCHI